MAIDTVSTQKADAPTAFPPSAPTDAYRTLHVAPSAPYELIEQAYWVLITRARRERVGDRRMGQLNDAYATLINPDRRAAHDLEHGLTKLRARPKLETPKRPMFSRGPRYTTSLTHYQLLDVHPDASAEVIDLAYAHRRTKLKGGDAKTLQERALVEEAYTTLSDAERRAIYDERVMAIGAAAAALPVAPEPVVAVEPVAAPEPTVEPTPIVPTVDAALPVAAATPAVEAPAEPDEGTSAAEKLGFVALAKRAFSRTSGEKAEKEDKHAQRTAADAAALAAIAAENRRLAELGLTAEPPVPASPVESLPVGSVRTQFRFVHGPQTGEVINLTENSVILGASDAADVRLANPDGMIGAGHVRVWRRDDEFILHQLDSFSITYVNGERLDLRLAILEPGDEIRVGTHTLIFDQTRVAAPDDEVSSS